MKLSKSYAYYKQVEEDLSNRPVPEGAHADYWKRMALLKQVLSEGFSIDLTLDFLYRQNNTDLLILKNIKVCLEHVLFVVLGVPGNSLTFFFSFLISPTECY